MSRQARVVGKAEVAPVRTKVIPIVTWVLVLSLLPLLGWYFWPSAPQFNWRTYLRNDADYSIDMPGIPETTLLPQGTEFGPTTVQTTQFVMQKPAALFAVHYSPFPANSPFHKMTKGQAEASLMRFVNLMVVQLDGKLLMQGELGQKGGFGREFRIEVPGGQVYHGRLLYLPNAQYQLAVIAPQETETPEYVAKFFRSFVYVGKE